MRMPCLAPGKWVANECRSVWQVEILALADVDSLVDRKDREHLFARSTPMVIVPTGDLPFV